MRNNIFKGLVLTALLTCSLSGVAQTKRIVTGKVCTGNNKPVEGVMLTVNHCSDVVGTTDEYGNFMIELPDHTISIVCHATGYKDKVMQVSSETSLTIELDADAAHRDRLIDVAMLQREKKESMTSAVSVVEGTELVKSPVAGFDAALTGRLAGLVSIQDTQQPSADGTRMYIRGWNSVNGCSPLVVLDGIPAPLLDMNTLDANSIESVTLLKDAAAKVLYGARASSGAILIKTKRGSLGRNKVEISADFSLQQPTVKPQTLNGADYAAMRNQALRNDGRQPLYSLYDIARFADQTAPGHDWYDSYMKNLTSMQRYHVNVSGGNSRVRYLVSTGYLHQGSLVETVKNNDYDPAYRLHRFNVLANVDVTLNKYLNCFLSTNVTFDRVNQSYNDLKTIVNSFYQMAPVVQGPMLEDNRVVATAYNEFPTYGLINRSGYSRNTGIGLNVAYGMNLDMGFLLPGLSLTGMVGYEANYAGTVYGNTDFERYAENGSRIFGTHTKQPLTLTKSSDMRYFLNFQSVLGYKRVFGEKHEVDAFVSYFYENMMKNGELPYDRISFGGHVKYGYDSRYYVQADFSDYGTEQFRPGHRFKVFPALSAAWVASNETFLKNLGWLSFLKFRASWGWLGNDQLGTARFLYATDIRYQLAGYLLSNYYAAQATEGMQGNPAIFYERSFQQNYGVDLTLFNTFGVSFDYWRVRQTHMAVRDYSTSSVRGIPTDYLPLENLGSMNNQGCDLELSYQQTLNADVKFKITANAGYSKNEVTDVRELNRTASGYYYPYRRTGYGIGQQFGYQIDYSNGNGYYNSAEELAKSSLRYSGTSPRVGDFVYKDLNEDGIIDERDMAPMDKAGQLPAWSYGAALQLDYKNFDLYVQIQGISGAAAFYSGVGVYDNVFQGVYTDLHKQAWTAERYVNHEEITYPALSTGGSSSLTANDFFYSKNNYMRLKNVVLGYTLPKTFIRKVKVQELRVYVSGNNLLTTSSMKFKHIDPEQYSYYEYPMYRTFNIGLNLKF